MRRPIFLLSAAALLAACATPPPEPDPTEEATLAQMMSMLSGGSVKSAEEVATIAARAASKPLGTPDNPVRAHMPAGQHAYLGQLRCANGEPPTWRRAGSAGMSIYGSIQDIYVVKCDGSQPASAEIWMDMYHPGYEETEAVPGYTMEDPPLPNMPGNDI